MPVEFNMAKISCRCLQCDKEFHTYPSQVKRGGGKFCSLSCTTIYRNLTDNPSWKPEVRKKISENHAPVPWLIESTKNRYKNKLTGTYRKKALKYYGKKCNRCNSVDDIEVHHIDRNRKNNDIKNLEVLCLCCHRKEHLEEKKKRPRCLITGRFLKKGG